MEVKEIEWEGVDWIYLALDRAKWWDVVSMVTNSIKLMLEDNIKMDFEENMGCERELRSSR